MSWLFSQALVEAYSGASSSGGEPCAPLSVMPTPHKFWRNDKTMEPCDLSRFGLTCAVLTAARGEELLTSFLAAFPARTSARPVRGRGLKAKGRDSGKNSPGSFARYDRDSCSWRTAQGSLLGGLMLFSATWPKWGSMRDGAAYRLPTPSGLMEHRAWITNGNASGLSVETMPTPLAHDVRSQGMGREIVNGRIQAANGGGSVAINLATLVRLPTPTVCGNHNRKGASTTSGDGLSTAVKRMPTASASDATRGGTLTENMTGVSLVQAVNSSLRQSTPIHSEATQGMQTSLTTEVGGSLNPPWVEWLMGWPIGWTASEPLETAKFRQWLRSHGESYEADLTTFNT